MKGSKTSLFYVIIKTYGAKYAATCMARLAKLTTRFLKDHGFSIGIDDVIPSDKIGNLIIYYQKIQKKKFFKILLKFVKKY
jgi:DNA-directed RNA polymerase III subunit RPC1